MLCRRSITLNDFNITRLLFSVVVCGLAIIYFEVSSAIPQKQKQQNKLQTWNIEYVTDPKQIPNITSLCNA